ncbi:hypothetical protein MN608_05313 [Microdochium nivale]|nr:hypothetical protein MN608_05313 [Microdochium nivale]
MKYSATAICALLVATAAAVPAAVLEASSSRPVVAKDCYCAPIPGACADSCGNEGACWSNCWGGSPWGKTAPAAEDVAEAE